MSIDGLVMPLLQDTADVGHGLVHVFLSDDGRNHGKGTESFVVQAADVVQADAADGDDGQAEVQGKGLGFLTYDVIGIVLRLGREHGAETNVIGTVGFGLFHFVDGIGRNADEDVRTGELADDLGRGIILADVDAVGPAGDGKIRRIIHNEGHIMVMAESGNGAGFFVLSPPFLMLFPVLDNGDAGGDQALGYVDVVSAQAEFFIAHDGVNRIF